MIIRTLVPSPLPIHTENFGTPCSDIEFSPKISSGAEDTCSEYMLTKIQLCSEVIFRIKIVSELLSAVLINLLCRLPYFKGVYHKRIM